MLISHTQLRKLTFRCSFFSVNFCLICFRPLTDKPPRPVAPSAPSLTAEITKPSVTRRARVLYDYDAADNTELSLLSEEVRLD